MSTAATKRRIGVISTVVVALVAGLLVWVATRPDAPRPIQGYYEAAEKWDADEAVQDASRQLGWTVRYEFPEGVPHYPGMPRPIDVIVVDRSGQPIDGLSGQFVAIRPADSRLTQRADLVAIPTVHGSYRTLVRIDETGTWEFRLDTRQQSTRFVHAARIDVPADETAATGVSAQ